VHLPIGLTRRAVGGARRRGWREGGEGVVGRG
jgi:hypothetical protein